MRCRAAEGADQPELRHDGVDGEAKPRLVRKFEAALHFTLCVDERISHGEQVRVQVLAGDRRISQVAGLVGGIEGPTQQITACLDMFRPWHDVIPEDYIGPRQEAIECALVDQLIAEPTELKSSLVVAGVRSRLPDTERNIGDARTVAVAALEAQVDQPSRWRGGIKVRSVNLAGSKAIVRTSSVARDAGSVMRGGQRALRSCGSQSATRSARIRLALPPWSDAATIRRPGAADSRGRPSRRDRAD